MDIICHGIAYKTGTALVMRYRKNPTQAGEFELKKLPPGYKTTQREAWRMAPEDVDDADKANEAALAQARELHANLAAESSDPLAPAVNSLTLPTTMTTTQQKKRKRDKEEIEEKGQCNVKKKYTDEQINKKHTSEFWNNKSREVQEELKAHFV